MGRRAAVRGPRENASSPSTAIRWFLFIHRRNGRWRLPRTHKPSKMSGPWCPAGFVGHQRRHPTASGGGRGGHDIFTRPGAVPSDGGNSVPVPLIPAGTSGTPAAMARRAAQAMVVTTVHTVITAMTAHAQSGREYSAWSMTATRGAAYPRLANRKTAIARHSGSELPALGRL